MHSGTEVKLNIWSSWFLLNFVFFTSNEKRLENEINDLCIGIWWYVNSMLTISLLLSHLNVNLNEFSTFYMICHFGVTRWWFYKFQKWKIFHHYFFTISKQLVTFPPLKTGLKTLFTWYNNWYLNKVHGLFWLIQSKLRFSLECRLKQTNLRKTIQ